MQAFKKNIALILVPHFLELFIYNEFTQSDAI